MIELEKAKKYISACGTPEKALIAIDALIESLHRLYPVGFDYHSSRNYQSIIKIKEEIENIKQQLNEKDIRI